jgi:hypothetical protein
VKALALTLALASCAVSQPRWYETDGTHPQRTDLDWGVTVLLLDPMTTDASTVDDLHGQRKRAVCRVGAAEADAILQLCRDKGFDAVSFEPGASSHRLVKRAEQLKLPVLNAPAGT